jgi:hypothetical protein
MCTSSDGVPPKPVFIGLPLGSLAIGLTGVRRGVAVPPLRACWPLEKMATEIYSNPNPLALDPSCIPTNTKSWLLCTSHAGYLDILNYYECKDELQLNLHSTNCVRKLGKFLLNLIHEYNNRIVMSGEPNQKTKQ